MNALHRADRVLLFAVTIYAGETLADIARKLRYSRQAAYQHADLLEERGLLESYRLRDGRRRIVRVTEAGRNALGAPLVCPTCAREVLLVVPDATPDPFEEVRAAGRTIANVRGAFERVFGGG